MSTLVAPRASAVRVGPRSALVLALASLSGLMMFAWPLLLVPEEGVDRVAPPFLFLALLPVLVLVVLVELTEKGEETVVGARSERAELLAAMIRQVSDVERAALEAALPALERMAAPRTEGV